MMRDFRTYPNEQRLMRAAADEIVAVAQESIASRGRFSIALAGGSTPKSLYLLLATPDYISRFQWDRVYVFWGDERCVPPEHVDSSYRMARETLLDHVPIPQENIHRIHGEDDPAKAALEYAQVLHEFFSNANSPRFDFILLGMGDDGHTASLFPGTAALHEQTRWVVENYVVSKQMWRITLSPFAINSAANVAFLVSGASKAERLHEVLNGEFQPDTFPAQIVNPANGRLLWLVDSASAALL
jgi:6-phosphogluconolactonase